MLVDDMSLIHKMIKIIQYFELCGVINSYLKKLTDAKLSN